MFLQMKLKLVRAMCICQDAKNHRTSMLRYIKFPIFVLRVRISSLSNSFAFKGGCMFCRENRNMLLNIIN
jgi:hypothetical protein